jgi:RNA-binding protein FUS
MPSGMGHEFRRDGDWTCPSCMTNCFASKNECFKCRTPKPQNNMYGGGMGMGGGMGGMGGMGMVSRTPEP